jgi:glycine/D-amino acid oxidase-like deaminating enzyme
MSAVLTAATGGHAALAGAALRPFWLDSPDAPEPAPALRGDTTADLLIVGAGFTGLWAAVQAKEEDPGRDILVLEAETAAYGASGRNGGFIEASLTHGILNGIERFPDELETLERLAAENLAGLLATLDRHGIDARYEGSGMITVATEPHQLEHLAETVRLERQHGGDAELLDGPAVRARVNSPTYLGGARQHTGAGTVDPAHLAWGLRRAAQELGVRLCDRTRVDRLRGESGWVAAATPNGTARARRVLLAGGGYSALLAPIRRLVAPVFDYVLVTEPLSAAQRAAIGWEGREGLADSGNQFHYYRLTPDDRILFGGFEAVYYFGNDVSRRRDANAEVFGLLADHLFETFPQLEGLPVSHAWGGVIDTCSRFCVTFGTAHGGRTAYAVGYTGLGVGATRFGARAALDLLDGRDTERTRLRLVRTRPLPFPPEPLRWPIIEVTRRALAKADANHGRRGPWLTALDRLGLGFDS